VASLKKIVSRISSWRYRKLWYWLTGISIILVSSFSFRDDLINNLGFISLTKALITHSTENAEYAENFFRRSLMLKPNNPAAYRGLGFALAMQGYGSEALEAWREIQFDATPVLVAWGQRAGREEQYDMALFWYRNILEFDNTTAEAWYQIGKIQHERNQLEEAVESYRKAVSLGYTESVESLGLVFFQQNEFAEAKAIWREALIRFPDCSERVNWWRDIVFALMAEKEWDRALEVITKAMKEFPDDSRLYFQLGVSLYEKNGDVEQATDALGRAIALDESLPGSYRAMGDIMIHEERYKEAIVWYTEAIARDAEKRTWYLMRADAAFLSDDTALALNLYQDTIERFPDLAIAHYEIAKIYLLIGQQDEAIESIEKALSLAESPNLQYYLRAGNIYEQAHENEKALQAYYQVLTMAPNNETAQQAIDRLREQ